MDPSSIILIGVAVVTLVAVAGVFTIAYRHSGGPDERASRTHPRSIEKVESRRTVPLTKASESEIPAREDAETEAVADAGSAGITVMEATRTVEVPPEEAGVTRRQFFNRAAGGMFGAYLATLGTASLAFLWPRLSGGFGARVDVGPIDDISTQLLQDGRVAPLVVNEARAYVVPINPDQLSVSQFDQPGLTAGGLMAMYWRCVHLGCRAPWCDPSGGFECPCHGSKYNLFGEYQAGPAPPQPGPIFRRGHRRRATHHRHRDHRPNPPGTPRHSPVSTGTLLYLPLTPAGLSPPSQHGWSR
ncbi:MAG: Rieske 2Fe-2S domain-containing protein [Acidimicrobiia bacterium]|nr:Rieske 2Fe-2S domain-containing protein [Acidimicrobiia bacterium]